MGRARDERAGTTFPRNSGRRRWGAPARACEIRRRHWRQRGEPPASWSRGARHAHARTGLAGGVLSFEVFFDFPRIIMNKNEEKILQLMQANPALLLIAQLDGGRVATDLAAEYPKLIEAVKLTGKKGELTLTLVIKPEGKGEVQTVEVLGQVKPKVPKRDRKPSIFFVEPDTHLLTRNDPNQADLPFRDETAPQGTARAAAAK
jgi:hypothetical protein